MLMASSEASEEASGLTICTKVNPDYGTKITVAAGGNLQRQTKPDMSKFFFFFFLFIFSFFPRARCSALA